MKGGGGATQGIASPSEGTSVSQLAVDNCQRSLSRSVLIWIIPSMNPLGDLNYPNRMTFS